MTAACRGCAARDTRIAALQQQLTRPAVPPLPFTDSPLYAPRAPRTSLPDVAAASHPQGPRGYRPAADTTTPERGDR